VYALNTAGLRTRPHQVRTLAIVGYLKFGAFDPGSSGHMRHDHLEAGGRLRGPSEAGRGSESGAGAYAGVSIRGVVSRQFVASCLRPFFSRFARCGRLAPDNGGCTSAIGEVG